MSGLVNKLKSFVGLVTDYEDDEEIYDDLYRAEDEYGTPNNTSMDTGFTARKKPNLRVVSHPTATSHEVMVVEPRSYDDALEVVNNLRERKTIILNLHLLDAEQSQRIVDFLSGATHAIDGHQQRVGEGVFIFTPNNVAISSETERARMITDAFWNQPQ